MPVEPTEEYKILAGVADILGILKWRMNAGRRSWFSRSIIGDRETLWVACTQPHLHMCVVLAEQRLELFGIRGEVVGSIDMSNPKSFTRAALRAAIKAARVKLNNLQDLKERSG